MVQKDNLPKRQRLHQERLNQWQKDAPRQLNKKRVALICGIVALVLALTLTLIFVLGSNTVSFIGNYSNGNYDIRLLRDGKFTANLPQEAKLEGTYIITAHLELTFEDGSKIYGTYSNENEGSFLFRPESLDGEGRDNIDMIQTAATTFKKGNYTLKLNGDGTFRANFSDIDKFGNFKGTYAINEAQESAIFFRVDDADFYANSVLTQGELTLPSSWQDSTNPLSGNFKKDK